MSIQPFQVRYNPMQLTSCSAFANINGAFRQQTKDVYFVRFIGCQNQAAFLQDLQQMDAKLLQPEHHYLRLLKFPDLPQPEQLDYYMRHWDAQEEQLHYQASDPLLAATLRARLQQLPALYQAHHPSASPSMLKNFMVKILFWADTLLPALLDHWDVTHAPKFVCSGVIKKQEYLFLYFLTQLGIDVLYINPAADLALDDALLQLSAKFDCKQYAAFTLPAPTAVKTSTIPVGSSESKQIRQPIPAAASVRIPPQDTPPVRKQERPPMHASTAQGNQPDCAAEKSFEELATLASSVVMIEVLDQEGQCFKTGSGILIHASGYILTNFHVVCDSNSYRIKLEGEADSYPCHELIKYNYVHDLALLRIDRACTPIPIYQGSKPLIRGQKVVAIGSPLGLFNSVSDGIISGFRTIQDTDMIQFTAPTSPGSSGGALLNMQGEVIGICTAGITEGQNLNLAVDYQTILFFAGGFLPKK